MRVEGSRLAACIHLHQIARGMTFTVIMVDLWKEVGMIVEI